MLKIEIYILALIILVSCNTSRNLSALQIKPIPENEKLLFSNHIYKLDTISRKSDDFNLGSRNFSTVLGLLHIKTAYSIDTISLVIDKNGNAIVGFRDGFEWRTATFKFKKKNRKFHQYYAERKIIEIPPVISLFYGLRRTDRLRLMLTPGGELIVQEKYVNHQNILLLGGGGEFKQLFYFRKY